MQVNWAPVWKGGASFEWLTKDVVLLASNYLKNQALLQKDNMDVKNLQRKMNEEYCEKLKLSEYRDFIRPETILVDRDEFNLITYFHEKDDEKSGDNVGALRVAACKTFLESRMKSEAHQSAAMDINVPQTAPMRTLVPEPVPRVAARATTQPAARASTLAVDAPTGSGAFGARAEPKTAAKAAEAAGAAKAAEAAEPAEPAKAAAVDALATGSGPVGAPAEPEQKKKRVAAKAVQLSTASPEELELERLFAGRGAGAGAGAGAGP
jgi:hypothetical protein